MFDLSRHRDPFGTLQGHTLRIVARQVTRLEEIDTMNASLAP
jgi:hypothetical protein